MDKNNNNKQKHKNIKTTKESAHLLFYDIFYCGVFSIHKIWADRLHLMKITSHLS